MLISIEGMDDLSIRKSRKHTPTLCCLRAADPIPTRSCMRSCLTQRGAGCEMLFLDYHICALLMLLLAPWLRLSPSTRLDAVVKWSEELTAVMVIFLSAVIANLSRRARPVALLQEEDISAAPATAEDSSSNARARVTVTRPTLAEAVRPEAWANARPLATELATLEDETAVWQLTKLREARALFAAMEAAKARSHDVLEFSFHPDELSTLSFSLAFGEDGLVHFSETALAFPLGFLPYLSIVHEPDLLKTLLPAALARPLDEFSTRHSFAANDRLFRVKLRGLGPIPGVDDHVSGVFYDLADDPSGVCPLHTALAPPVRLTPEPPAPPLRTAPGAVLALFETPPADAAVFRGLELSPCSPRPAYTRTRAFGLMAYLTPSSAGSEAHGRLDVQVSGTRTSTRNGHRMASGRTSASDRHL